MRKSTSVTIKLCTKYFALINPIDIIVYAPSILSSSANLCSIVGVGLEYTFPFYPCPQQPTANDPLDKKAQISEEQKILSNSVLKQSTTSKKNVIEKNKTCIVCSSFSAVSSFSREMVVQKNFTNLAYNKIHEMVNMEDLKSYKNSKLSWYLRQPIVKGTFSGATTSSIAHIVSSPQRNSASHFA
jgi:hypothetical protein